MEEEPQRPKAVTVIGWIWVVVGGLYLLRSVVDLVMWKALQPAAPALLREVERQDPELRFLRPLFEHLTGVKIAQVVAGAAVVLLAFQFLRLRPRARVGIQIVCWIVLGYVVSFAALWVVIWARALALAPGDPRFSGSHGQITLGLGLGVSVAFATGLIVMIVLLRSSQVRHAFERPDARAP